MDYYFVFGNTTFCIRPHVSEDIARVFDFLVESLKSQQKLAKMITTHFTIYLCSKNLTHFTNLNSLDIENNMLLQHSQKPFSLYKFSSQHFSVWCQKKYLHCINSSCPRTAYSWSSLKANVCIFLCISVRNFCSRDVVGFYLAWRGWIISLRVARCLSL